MKTTSKLIAALSISLFSLTAFADAPAGDPGKGEGSGGGKMHDCSKIDDAGKKAKCEAHQAAHQAAMAKCKGLEKAAHHKCMEEARPKKDK